MPNVVERFVSDSLTVAQQRQVAPEVVIQERLAALQELTGGYDFAAVIAAYWQGHDTGNEQLKADAVRWLRGEYATRTDARSALGVIHDRVIAEAARDLAFTTLKVKEIGQSLGFDDPAYFSRFFTKSAGLSPRTYRAVRRSGVRG